MFKSILIRNSYIPTNKDVYIQFEKGLNVIVGRNGIGKSCILEYLGYVLYGTTALRSSIKEYPEGFYVEGVFSIEGIVYKIERTSKTAKMYELIGVNADTDEEEWSQITNGTSATNTRIKDLLGYDFGVYQLVSFCKQHELLSLTNSTPTQLLNLIEYVSGLSGSYRLENELKIRRKEVSTEETAIRHSVNVSIKAIDDVFAKDPEFELLLEKYGDTALDTMRMSLLEYINIQDECSKYIHELEGYITQYKNLQASLEALKKYEGLCLEDYQDKLSSIKVLEEERSKLSKAIRSVSPPSVEYDESFLDTQQEVNLVYDRWKAEKRFRDALEAHKVECPNCKHTFYNNRTDVQFEFTEEPPTPVLTIREIGLHRKWLSTKEKYQEDTKRLEEVDSQLTNIDATTIKDTMSGIIEYQAIMNSLTSLNEKVVGHCKYRDNSIVSSINHLKSVKATAEKDYHELDATRERFSQYIVEKLEHVKKEEVRKNFGKRLQEVLENKRIYTLLTNVLKEVKNNIQATVLPRLNLIASSLLSQVTYGHRNKIEITKDFKLYVDGQDVDTLEGSAQVLTNIALRCALLITFYSDVFLVSLQDESDAALSEDRFENLLEAYKQLEGRGFQIIVISHKEYDYGNIINLEDKQYYV